MNANEDIDNSKDEIVYVISSFEKLEFMTKEFRLSSQSLDTIYTNFFSVADMALEVQGVSNNDFKSVAKFMKEFFSVYINDLFYESFEGYHEYKEKYGGPLHYAYELLSLEEITSYVLFLEKSNFISRKNDVSYLVSDIERNFRFSSQFMLDPCIAERYSEKERSILDLRIKNSKNTIQSIDKSIYNV